MARETWNYELGEREAIFYRLLEGTEIRTYYKECKKVETEFIPTSSKKKCKVIWKTLRNGRFMILIQRNDLFLTL